MKRLIISIIAAAMLALIPCGCGESKPLNKNLDTSKEVSLKITGIWTDFSSLETISAKFMQKYPNVDVEYEYLQDYTDSLLKRLEADDNKIDIFLTGSIQADSPLLPYAANLYDLEYLDFSNTYEGLLKNFEMKGSNGTELYCIPYGAELRGLYVNKTLLAKYGLSVPTNRAEFLNSCQVLKEAGYIPLQTNPGSFGQQLLYPYICNSIVNSGNYDELYKKISTCETGVEELFREPMQFLYSLMENYYYDYKTCEIEYNHFDDISNGGYAKAFFGIVDVDGTLVKKDDVGDIAFMTGSGIVRKAMDKCKEDYHSDIEYEFILAPTGEDGGYAYISPSQGFAINNKSDNIDWAVEYLNCFFTDEYSKAFADAEFIIPNSKDANSYVSKMFDVPESHISQLGQMTFDYDFYSIVTDTLIDISKGNNPKYMNDDGNGNVTLYGFEYYMGKLKDRFDAQRNGTAE